MTQIIDRDGLATIASAEAQSALDAGDTERARDRFAHAGALLEHELKKAMDDQAEHLLRFLAATQFYKGGHYQRALELAKKIKAAKLPANTERLLPKFMQDVKNRASLDYQARAHRRLQALWTAQKYQEIIELLQEDPYIIPPADLAFNRAICCEMLGKYRPAVLFFANASRRSQNNAEVLAALAPLPINLAAQRRLAEAWEYAQAQLELFPNAVSYAVASLLCYQRASKVEGNAKTSILKDQTQYFERAREEYTRMPVTNQNHPNIRYVMGLMYETAAWALFRAHSPMDALEVCDAATAFDPALPNIWTLRGIIHSSGASEARLNAEAATAFKKAVALGDKTYWPYYYLAHDAMTNRNYREAFDWSKQALARTEGKDALIQSLLYQWAAISLDQLGGPREEIENLFKKAMEVAPDNELARKNYHSFQTSDDLETPRRPHDESQEVLLPFIPPDRNADEVKRRLAKVAG